MLESAPTDDPESVLISIARRLDRGDYPLSQVGVQLLQIGDDQEVSSKATRSGALEHDDGMTVADTLRQRRRCRNSMRESQPHTACAIWSTRCRTMARR